MPDSSLMAGIIVAIPTLLTTYWAYRRGKGADEHAAQLASTAQVYQGYDRLLERAQTDVVRKDGEIADLRQRNADLERRIREYLNGIKKP